MRQIVERVAPILPFGLARRIRGDQLLLSQLQHLLDHHRGNRVGLAARPHKHGLGHRKGKRQVDGEAGALPPREAHLHASAEGGDFAAHHVHADAAPGHLRDLGGGGESRVENEIGYLRLRERRTGFNEALFDRFLADPVDREARAVIGQRELHFVAFLFQLETNFADFRLGRGPASVRRLDAVGDGVAQQVLERSGDALEHRAVELDLGALDIEIGALSDFLRGLAHDAVKAFLEAAERDHAHAHQVLLQVTVEPRLREQRLLGFVHCVDEVSVHGRHVVDAFRHQPRHFLEAGEAVEFKRVEFTHGFPGELLARLHLRLRLDFDLAQLRAQPRDVVGELLHGRLERAHFALDSAARDGDFAGLEATAMAGRLSSGTRGFCSRSNKIPMRSHDVSNSANRAVGSVLTDMAFSTRVSMWCVSSPSAMAPAMRALPFRVCSTRCRAWPSAELSGLSRQSRMTEPTAGISSWASSMKVCKSSGSMSSSSRRWRRSSVTSRSRSSRELSSASVSRSSSAAPLSVSRDRGDCGVGSVSPGVVDSWETPACSPMRSNRATSSGTARGTCNSTTLVTIASIVSIASPTSDCSSSESSLVASFCRAFSNA